MNIRIFFAGENRYRLSFAREYEYRDFTENKVLEVIVNLLLTCSISRPKEYRYLLSEDRNSENILPTI